jgi:hypothetical protein
MKISASTSLTKQKRLAWHDYRFQSRVATRSKGGAHSFGALARTTTFPLTSSLVRLLCSFTCMMGDSLRRSLPVELIERVIHYLHKDKPALRACSYVRSDWTHCAQTHLFHTVELAIEAHWLSLWAIMATSPHLAPLIRVLDVSSRLPLAIELTAWSKRILLPNVHVLIFNNIHYQHGLLSFAPHLRALRFRGCVGAIAASALASDSADSHLTLSTQDAHEQLCDLETIAFDDIVAGKEWIQTHVLRDLTRRRSIHGITTAILEWSFFVSQEAILDLLVDAPSLRNLTLIIYLHNVDARKRGFVITSAI